ncbi:hypothetical protein [Nonomuraea polychroma]|uniref:hypothetical protein n=1 Tax=Nonomuraea polychroma TaxID=46176 RepID=UPI000FDD5949|nr:hypothetical protein [Nonomuraea polychroma]
MPVTTAQAVLRPAPAPESVILRRPAPRVVILPGPAPRVVILPGPAPRVVVTYVAAAGVFGVRPRAGAAGPGTARRRVGRRAVPASAHPLVAPLNAASEPVVPSRGRRTGTAACVAAPRAIALFARPPAYASVVAGGTAGARSRPVVSRPAARAVPLDARALTRSTCAVAPDTRAVTSGTCAITPVRCAITPSTRAIAPVRCAITPGTRAVAPGACAVTAHAGAVVLGAGSVVVPAGAPGTAGPVPPGPVGARRAGAAGVGAASVPGFAVRRVLRGAAAEGVVVPERQVQGIGPLAWLARRVLRRRRAARPL